MHNVNIQAAVHNTSFVQWHNGERKSQLLDLQLAHNIQQGY